MADNDSGHLYYGPRDSYMCVSAEMQGFLEKKGVLGNRSKFWCSIQQSTLYMQKSNGQQKSPRQGDIVKTIDLKDCHQVRKVTAEITGTHFEICQKKKTHVFICPASENCTMWVKALQAAMALKDAGQLDSDLAAESQNISHVYESYGEILRDSKVDAVSCKLAEYSEPSDAKKASKVVNNNSEYWEIGHASGSLDNPQTTTQSISDQCNRQNLSQQTFTDAKSEASQGECEQEIYSDGLSLAAEVKKTMLMTCRVNAELNPGNSVVRRCSESSGGVYSDAYSTANVLQPPSVTARDDILKPSDTVDFKVTVTSDEDENPFNALLDSLSGRDSPIPDFVHPLTEEDIKPVEDLQEFLHRNPELCQVGYVLLPREDPVNSLKSYLKTLTIAETGH
ncbi:unnamed protein product [Candidula unifasciata]|uniref:PH domain-containing protein n=1 Tax=Candidula unifasciata TaxID=100452 RepID=A0A8S3YYY0_9EUPU|nr:unnamed protein product [Candidula unifasciata]